METLKNIVLIESFLPGNSLSVAGISKCNNEYLLEKIYMEHDKDLKRTNPDWIRQYFPQAEIVDDMEAITNDNNIGLLIISSPDENAPKQLAQLIQSGKDVRII